MSTPFYAEVRMSDKNEKNGVKVLQVLESLLFLGKVPKNVSSDNKEKSSKPDDIKNRVLLKIERAEIMSAMMEMRDGKKDQD